METQDAINMFNALSQETRLNALKTLVKAGHSGMAAGHLGKVLGTAHNTLSFHLSTLQDAGLITSEKQGRSMIYRANFAGMQQLIRFLVADCCSEDAAKLSQNPEQQKTSIELFGCC